MTVRKITSNGGCRSKIHLLAFFPFCSLNYVLFLAFRDSTHHNYSVLPILLTIYISGPFYCDSLGYFRKNYERWYVCLLDMHSMYNCKLDLRVNIAKEDSKIQMTSLQPRNSDTVYTQHSH